MNPHLEQLDYSNLYTQLPDNFYQPVAAQPIQAARLVSINPAASALIGLPPEALTHDSFIKLMAGEYLPENACSIATVYAGHQFGGFSPQLGDGRALLIGQVRNSHNQLWELQLKGAGHTPYSRFGDGRAVLRSTIREYLCSEAMHGLGIATTRAMAIATSTTQVQRERIEPAATLLRMAPSHIRFGHFEYFFYSHQHEALQQLADFVIEHHYPDLLQYQGAERYSLWLDEIVNRTAKLIAQWQAYGFAHGVMNTDNMSILGLTIDYGPFAFLDDFDPALICNHSDHTGRYAFNKQVSIGLWNLNALAHSLSKLIPVEQLRASLMRYEAILLQEYRTLMRRRFGLYQDDDDDDRLMSEFLELLQQEKADFHFSFRKLSQPDTDNTHPLRDYFVDRERFDNWQQQYQQRLRKETLSSTERLQRMRSVNPKYILRNYLAQEAIELAEQGDFSRVNQLLEVLLSPFDEHPNYEAFAQLPPDWGKKLEISCSS